MHISEGVVTAYYLHQHVSVTVVTTYKVSLDNGTITIQHIHIHTYLLNKTAPNPRNSNLLGHYAMSNDKQLTFKGEQCTHCQGQTIPEKQRISDLNHVFTPTMTTMSNITNGNTKIFLFFTCSVGKPGVI
jgi:hypothetical protein